MESSWLWRHHATEVFLENNKSPSRKVNDLDNRGSHFYLALYWAQALAEQNDDAGLKTVFFPLAETLMLNEGKILNEFIEAQGKPVELNGYYWTDPDALAKAMRPSAVFNKLLDSISE